MGKGDISGWLPSPGVAPRGGRIPLAAEKRRGRFTVLNNSKWVGSSVHREEGCSLWETDSKAASCRWGCLRFLICPEQTGFGAPSSLDALFAPINVKSEPKGGYKKATRVGGMVLMVLGVAPAELNIIFFPARVSWIVLV